MADILLAYGSVNSMNSSGSVSLVENRSGNYTRSRSESSSPGDNNRGSNSRDDTHVKPIIPIGVRAFHEGERLQVSNIICIMVTKPGHVKDGLRFVPLHPASYLILALLHVPHPLTPYPISRETRRAIRKSHNCSVAA